MVVYFGLNHRIGNVSYYDSTGQSEYSFTKPYSEQTAQVIDEEVSKMVESAYERAKKIITENKDKLIKLGDLLLEKEVIFREDLESIFGKRPYEPEGESKAEQNIEAAHPEPGDTHPEEHHDPNEGNPPVDPAGNPDPGNSSIQA